MLAHAFEVLAQALPLIGLLSIRVGIAMATLPPPFGNGPPARVRVALGLLVAYVIALPHIGTAPALSIAPMALLRSSVGEMLIGSVIGLTVRVALAAIDVAGNLAGLSMGLGFAMTVDPSQDEQGLATAALLRSLAMLIFFAIGGHHALLEGLAASVVLAPPEQVFAAVGHMGVTQLGSDLVAQGLRIAAPIMATMFLVQAGLGLISRAAPKVQVFSFSFALASATGMLTLLIAAPNVAYAIALHLRQIPGALMQILSTG